jgi:hypothetical protein
MTRRMIFSTVILSALMITSCATDKIQVKRNNDTACKTPESRYDYGKKTMRSAKIIDRNRSGSGFITTRNNRLKGSSVRKNPRKDTGPVNPMNETTTIRVSNQLLNQTNNEQTLNQDIPGSFYLGPRDYELLSFPVNQQRIINPGDLIINQSSNARLVSDEKPDIKSINLDSDPGQVNINNIQLARSSDKDEMILNTGRPGNSKAIPAGESEYIFLLMALLSGLIPLGIIKANPKLAANISFWAAMNPWKTRLIFALINAGLITSGLLIGKHLANNNIHFSSLSRDLLFGVFLSSILLYPEKHTSIKLLKHTYLKQKAFDLALAVSGFMLMVTTGNDPDMRASFTKLTEFKSSEQQNTVKSVDQSNTNGKLVLNKNENLRQDQADSYIEEEKLMKRKTGLRILTVLGAIILGVAVAGGACALECNGMTGLAVATGVGGGVLIIVLAAAAFKAIRKLQPKKEIKPSDSPGSAPGEGVLQT